jgi:nitronate monooxygenase
VSSRWPDNRLIDLFEIEHPIIMAPMVGAMDAELAAEVSAAGGLGSLPCAMLTPAQVRDQFAQIRARTGKPVNVKKQRSDWAKLRQISAAAEFKLGGSRC